LQAQELNEIQEQIQNQTTSLNKLLEKWPVTTDDGKMNAFSNIDNIGSVITVDPDQMTVNSNANSEATVYLNQGSHLIIDSNGFSYFVNGVTLNNSGGSIINSFKKRYVNSTVLGWETLKDSPPSNSFSLNDAGAGRLQWYNPMG